MSKDVIIFPYINITKIIKMDDFEILPFSDYNLKEELEEGDISILNEFIDSFRETLFHKGKAPEKANGIGILKYKGTILRTTNNSKYIGEKIKILFLLLKLHISIDSFNQWMSIIDVKVFEYFQFNFSNNYTNKFGTMGECKVLYSTIPESIKGLKDIKFYHLSLGINNIPTDFSIASNSDEFLGIHPEITDMSYLYNNIKLNTEYYKKFINISSINYGLETQKDLFFYFSLIPTIIEVILYPITSTKKKAAVEYGDMLDEKLIKDNDFIIIKCCNEERERGLIARTISEVYDIRNKLLHQGVKEISKGNIMFKGYKLSLYDVFQLIFKFSILNDFKEKGIIENNFLNLVVEGNIFQNGGFKVIPEPSELYMDFKLDLLLKKAKSDKEFEEG